MKKSIKIIVSSLLIIILVFSFVACGSVLDDFTKYDSYKKISEYINEDNSVNTELIESSSGVENEELLEEVVYICMGPADMNISYEADEDGSSYDISDSSSLKINDYFAYSNTSMNINGMFADDLFAYSYMCYDSDSNVMVSQTNTLGIDEQMYYIYDEQINIYDCEILLHNGDEWVGYDYLDYLWWPDEDIYSGAGMYYEYIGVEYCQTSNVSDFVYDKQKQQYDFTYTAQVTCLLSDVYYMTNTSDSLVYVESDMCMEYQWGFDFTIKLLDDNVYYIYANDDMSDVTMNFEYNSTLTYEDGRTYSIDNDYDESYLQYFEIFETIEQLIIFEEQTVTAPSYKKMEV